MDGVAGDRVEGEKGEEGNIFGWTFKDKASMSHITRKERHLDGILLHCWKCTICHTKKSPSHNGSQYSRPTPTVNRVTGKGSFYKHF